MKRLSLMSRAAAAFVVALSIAGFAAAPPARAQEPTAGQLALARIVVEGSGISRSFDDVVPQAMDQIGRTLVKTRPELATDLNKVFDLIQPEFMPYRDEMYNAATRLFARRLSEADLKEIAAFFTSPAGKKYVEVQPPLLDEMVVSMQAFTQNVSAKIFERTRVEMKKLGHEF